MEIFNFNLDRLVNIWVRDKLSIEANNLEEAIEFLKLDKENDFSNYFEEREFLYETEELSDKPLNTEIILSEAFEDTVVFNNIEGWIE